MKKHVSVLALLLVFALMPLCADIGENFSKGGVGLAGSVSFYDNFFYFQDPSEQRKFWSLDVSPSVDFYVADRLALQFSPWFHTESDTTDPNNIDRYTAYGARFGVDYALILDPGAMTGLVVSAGCLVGLAIYPTVNDLVAGTETPNNYARTDLLFTLTPRLYYFLNDRLAPYLAVTPQVGYILSYASPSGATVNLTGQQRLRAKITVAVGISFFVPNKKASMFGG